MQGFVAESAAAAVPGPARAPGADLCLRFREHEPHALLRLLHAHRQLLRGQRAGLQRPAAGQGAGDPRASTRTSCRPKLFTQEFKLPVYDTPQATRENLAQGRPISSSEAGWVNQDGKLVNEKTGEQFKIEFLGDDPTDERVTAPFIDNLRKLGIDASLRIVDRSQYVNRVSAISTSTW